MGDARPTGEEFGSEADNQPSAAPGPAVVVGLGASAGGITALEKFFGVMPSDSGGAFVVVLHLDPTHASSVAEILGRHTAMPVTQAVNGQVVSRDHVYVIPPNTIITIERNTLRLQPPTEPRGFRMPVDHFLASLGADRRQRAVGIVLSGTGSDGTTGLRMIKGSGGLTIAQDPGTADQTGMIRSAIEMGVVDHVLPISEMPAHIVQYARHAYTNEDEPEPSAHVKDDTDLSGALAILRTRVRLDFSSYRKGTIRRRLQRRMVIRQVETIPEYMSLLRDDPVEVQLLAADMLIGVTGFFREREAWDKLEELVVRPLVAAKGSDEPIRVWVPACASGEEAYSLTMLIFRHLEEAQKTCPLQVFATDINYSALAHAHAGSYSSGAVADVPPDYLQRYFVKEGDRYKVVKVIREAIAFAAQNLITDPPYSKLDVISCRNLLIYLEPDRQKRLLSVFHFALRENGYLFLGNAEAIGQQTEQFAAISRKWRIYRRTGAVRLHRLDLTVRDTAFGQKRPQAGQPETQGERVIRHAEQAVLRRFAPACAIVDRQSEIRFLFGPTDRFLNQPEGALTSNIFEWCKGSIRTKLRGALHRMWERGDGAETLVIRASRDDPRSIRMTVEPIVEPRDLQGMALVSFQEALPPSEPEAALAEAEGPAVQGLEEELRETRNDLQTTIEELQTSNEEFKAVNEEALSINEELQSTNEELETSKEELQSLNEELLTVNFQLQTKLGELEQRNDDLDNLLRSTDLAAIFLDRHFRIKWFSPAMTSLLSLIPADVGRPLGDFAARFTDPDLLAESETVLRDLVPVTREIQTHDGRWYLRRLLPYRTRADRIDGIVITFTDVTALRQAELKLQERTEALETRVSQRTSLLQLLYDVAGEANQAPSVAEAIHAVLKLVCQHGDWQVGHVWEFDEINSVVVPLDLWYVAPGEAFTDLIAATMRTTLGPGEGLIRKTLATGEVHWVEDVARQSFVRGDLAAQGIKSGVAIPVLVKGRPLAVLEFYSRRAQPQPGTRFLTSLGNVGQHLGYVMERQKLEKHIADQSDRERRTVGQEIHDTVGQSLAAMAMMTRDLLQDLQAGRSTYAVKAARIQDGIESTKDELRKVIRGMLPVELDGTGLLNALIDLSERSRVDGTTCRFVTDDPGMIGLEDGFVGAQLFRIAQEAVRNALKHARASEIVIALRGNGRVELEVSDNGTGDWKGNTGGSGMRIMRYRADLIGGRIEVGIERGMGTRIVCIVARRPRRTSHSRDAG
jgi:two-component system, chemotaxis family, CheB/CheR fusion protein